ncbi:hypothetical protein [Nocardia sp. NPDC003183]
MTTDRARRPSPLIWDLTDRTEPAGQHEIVDGAAPHRIHHTAPAKPYTAPSAGAARERHIEVRLLHRHLPHEHVVAGLAAALQAGVLTSDAVALEARKIGEFAPVETPVVDLDAPGTVS